jgi:cell division protein FtsI (penicillin-binding protein 3)
MNGRAYRDLFPTAGRAMRLSRIAGRGAYMPPRMDDDARRFVEMGRARIVVAGIFMALVFTVIGGRLTQLAVRGESGNYPIAIASERDDPRLRANIVDRNGEILATDLQTASLYANPRRLLDAEKAARALAEVLPDMDYDAALKKLKSDRGFVWLRRHLTPRQQWALLERGIPGLDFIDEYTRTYPHGTLMPHLLGYVDSDNRGIAGLEKQFERHLAASGAPLRLTIDMRVQHLMRQELGAAMREFQAQAATGIVMDVRNGEILSLVSLPDFDPNHPGEASDEARFNRATLGVYELGSTFKIFTAAMALDAGAARMNKRYDATKPLRVSRFMIRDYHAKKRWLTLPEVFVYSSNIGAALMARDIGGKRQRNYLDELGMLDAVVVELPETGKPITPATWRPVHTLTIGFGHGIAVSPLHLVSGVAAAVNGGILNQPTIVADEYRTGDREPRRVFKKRTSEQIRKLMRLTVENGTGRNADAAGYAVGGKTGTAEKPSAKGYAGRRLLSSFIGAFPINDPRYVVLALLDEPKGTKATQGYATGGWVAAPVVRRVVERMAPMLGMPVVEEDAPGMRELETYIAAEGRRLASY